MPQNKPTWRWAFVVSIFMVPCAALSAWAGWAWMNRPPDHRPAVARAREMIDRGYPDLAIRALSHIRDEGQGAAEGLALAGRALLMRGNLSLARKALEKSIAMQPKQAEAAKMLAAVSLALGDGPRGLELLMKAAELDPSDFRPHYAMGKVHHDLGDIKASAEAYGRALERQPPPAELKDAHIGRARALLDSGQSDAASADLEALARIAPEDPTTLAFSARLARDQDRLDDATALAERAVQTDPRSFDARLVRAQIRSVRGQPESALDDLQRAIEINPNHLGALQLLLQTQTRLGRDADAAETRKQLQASRERTELMDRLTKEINRRPDDPEPRFRMGQAALEGKMYVLAYQCFQAALEIDPRYAPARQALASMSPPPGVMPTPTAAVPHPAHGR